MQALFRLSTASLAPIAAIMFVGATAVTAQQPQPRLDVPYVPTPQEVVDRMLQLGKVRTGEYHIDLGSGDGRIAVTSASQARRAFARASISIRCASRRPAPTPRKPTSATAPFSS